jgi:hypothetical protein
MNKLYPNNSPIKYAVTGNAIVAAHMLAYCMTLDIPFWWKVGLGIVLACVLFAIWFVWKGPRK